MSVKRAKIHSSVIWQIRYIIVLRKGTVRIRKLDRVDAYSTSVCLFIHDDDDVSPSRRNPNKDGAASCGDIHKLVTAARSRRRPIHYHVEGHLWRRPFLASEGQARSHDEPAPMLSSSRSAREVVESAAASGGSHRADGEGGGGDEGHTRRSGPRSPPARVARRARDYRYPGKPLPLPVLPRRHCDWYDRNEIVRHSLNLFSFCYLFRPSQN